MEFNNLEQEINDVNRELAAEIRKLSPVDTGRLKRSIETERTIETQQGIIAPISLLSYYKRYASYSISCSRGCISRFSKITT